MNASVKLYSLSYKEAKTYLFATLFVAGNIILPQLCHLIPGGGLTWLPIYFFTLIAAYKYGWKVGLLTATLSPVINHLLFGMPPAAVLPIILIKSSLLAFSAAAAAKYFKGVYLYSLLLCVVAYQAIGFFFEWGIERDFYVALQDFRIGIPGLLVQVFGGYVALKLMAKL